MNIPRTIDNCLDVLAPFLQGKDAAESYVTNGHYYESYHAYSALWKPKRILEIGVRHGYSSLMMLAGHAPEEIWLVDNEEYDGRLSEVVKRLAQVAPQTRAIPIKVNSHDIKGFPIPFDLIHVDGDHHTPGALADLQLAETCIVPGGKIIVDDGECPPVRDAVIEFLRTRPWYVAHERLATRTVSPTHWILWRRDECVSLWSET